MKSRTLFFKLTSLTLTLTILLTTFAASVSAAPLERPEPPQPDEYVPEETPTPGREGPFPPRWLLEVDSLPVWTADQPPPQPGPELRLAAGAFDPVLESASDLLPSRLMLDAYPADVDGYYILQFDGPILPEWKAELEETGAQLFDYVPDFAFVVKMNARIRALVETLPHTRWVGLYQPGFRLAVTLFDGTLPANAVPGQLMVVVFPGEDLDPITEELEALGGQVLEVSQSHWKSKIKLAINPSLAVQVAAINGVRWVEPVPVYELSNNEAADIIGVRPVWDNRGLYGAGQIVGVCDTGLDQGSTAPGSLHDDFEDGSGNSRVIALYDLVGGGDGAEDRNSGHGTHVAGSVLGNGDLSGATPANHSFPSTSYAGMAPDARLVFQAVENDGGSLVGIPLDLNTLFIQAYNDGARIHSNSWSSGVPYGSYSPGSEDVDEFVWDHPNFLPLFAAANDGIDENGDGVIDLNSVPSPGTAKNCVTVGATENDRPSGSTPTPGYDIDWGTGSWAVLYPSPPVSNDHVSDDPSGMAAFSSRGPTLDGRYKPDVVAPGTNIASVRSSLASGTGWGAIDANYMFMGGTSMATPLTAGATALIREWYTRTQVMAPSAALMKATLVNGAFDIYPGQYGTGATQEITPTVPNNVEGWGRVDIEDSVFPTAPRRFQYVDEQGGLDTGEVHTYTFQIVTDSVPLRANLVWSDYPGSTAAAGGLVNDLDLTLYGPGGTTYYPANAVQRGVSRHLFYDDWGADGGYTWAAGIRTAVRFTPTSYPVTVDKGLFLLASNSSTYPKTFNYYIYDDDGTSGEPGTVLASGSTTVRRYGWHVINLSGHNITISSGDFYLAIELPDTDLAWHYDATAPIVGRSWDYSGGSWSNWTTNDYMFQAVVRSADLATSHDRVNNVVGIHVPTTALQSGYYTLTVRGYNVPQGPQPYALTLNGGLAELLDIGKVAAPDPVLPDTLLTYTLRITNTGITTATQVVLTETYDSNVTYQSATPSPSNGNNVWSLGEIGSGQVELITVTVRTASGLSAGTRLTNVATVDSIQTDPRAITVTTPIYNLPEPTWNKRVYVNGVLTDTFPATVVANDAVEVVDRVWITYTANVTFTLAETWIASLDLTGWISNTGSVATTTNSLTWNVVDVAPNAWCAITKTFQVLTGTWETDTITESLWVEDADPQLDDRVVTFQRAGVCVPPTITDLQSDSPVTLGDAMHFTATVSGDMPITCTWNFDDGTPEQTGALTTTSHTYAAAGTYTVTLMVDNGCAPTDTDSIVVTVNPGPTYYTLTMATDGIGTGTVTPTVGTHNYISGTTVWLTATADAGSMFDGWSGDAGGTTSPVSVTMDGNKAVTATFTVICIEVTSVNLTCTNTGTIYTDTVVYFSADVEPVNASAPYTYIAETDVGLYTGQMTTTVIPITFDDLFGVTGTHAATITVWNCNMPPVYAISDTITFTVREQGECVELDEITIAGDTSGYPGVYTFTTDYEPFDASIPITYTWDDGGDEETSVRSLDVGTYTLMVSATNPCTLPPVTDTHQIIITAAPVCTEVTGITLAYTPTGTIYTDTVVHFRADIEPNDADMPYTYTIDYGSGPTLPNIAAVDPYLFTYTFPITGTHTVTFSAWNCAMIVPVSDSASVTVSAYGEQDFFIYLPVVLRNY